MYPQPGPSGQLYQGQVTVIYNPPPPNLAEPYVSNAGFRMALSGLSAGEMVVVEASSDLQHWTQIQTNTMGGSTLSIAEPVHPALPGQLFRAPVQ